MRGIRDISLRLFLLLATLGMFASSAAWGQDTGALKSGDWASPDTWSGGVPGINSYVTIGGYDPNEPDVPLAGSATVTLTADATANGIGLGYGQSADGEIDLSGHKLTVINGLTVGYGGGTSVINDGNGGSFFANVLDAEGGSFSLGANDTVTNIYVVGGPGTIVTTSAPGNVTDSVLIDAGGKLALGADLNVSNTIDVHDQSVLDAQGHALTAAGLSVGVGLSAGGDSGASTVENLGRVTLGKGGLEMDEGSHLTLHGGDTINGPISLVDGPSTPSNLDGSVLTVEQAAGAGLTLNGTSSDDLSIALSAMVLDFNGPGWDFRWMDPSGSDWVSTLETMINDGQIVIDMPSDDRLQVYDLDGYTYIAAVPEPSALVLACLGAAGVGLSLAARRRAARRR